MVDAGSQKGLSGRTDFWESKKFEPQRTSSHGDPAEQSLPGADPQSQAIYTTVTV